MREYEIDGAVEGLMAAGYSPEEVSEIVEGLTEATFVEEEPEVVDHRLRETGNGPTISYEEALLQEYFGAADDEGVYR